MAGFERTLEELFARADPQSLLDVGCGEGVLTHKWAQRLAPRRVVGIDLEDPTIQAEWEQRQAPNLEYRIMKAENLPFADAEFDVATAIEVLEHVPDPAHTVAEMARVAERWLLVSVPREPLWRTVNMARGAYLKDLGNTPGHVNHWSKRSFVSLLGAPRRGRRGALAVPVDDAARPALSTRAASRRAGASSGYGRGARILSIGIALDRGRHVRVLLGRVVRPRRRRLQADLAAVVGAVRHRLGDLPADRAAALAHDRRPPRARLRARPPAAHAAAPAG